MLSHLCPERWAARQPKPYLVIANCEPAESWLVTAGQITVL